MTSSQFEKVKWGDIMGFQFEKLGDNDVWRIDCITINGLGHNGLFRSLKCPRQLIYPVRFS
jgi:hypothetical protein